MVYFYHGWSEFSRYVHVIVLNSLEKKKELVSKSCVTSIVCTFALFLTSVALKISLVLYCFHCSKTNKLYLSSGKTSLIQYPWINKVTQSRILTRSHKMFRRGFQIVLLWNNRCQLILLSLIYARILRKISQHFIPEFFELSWSFGGTILNCCDLFISCYITLR